MLLLHQILHYALLLALVVLAITWSWPYLMLGGKKLQTWKADKSRRHRHTGNDDYDRGYRYGYEEAEEDDAWDDEGGDPYDPEYNW